MLKAVLFDLDNTLIDRDNAFERCLSEIFGDGSIRALLRSLDRRGHGCRQAFFKAWAEHGGPPLEQAEFGRRLARHIQPEPALLARLRALGRGHKLGLISNGGGETQRGKLQAAGLDKVFAPQHVWISGEVGLEKPDPRLFWLACRALGEKPRSCLYIGDHEEIDGGGARAAGMLFQRAGLR